MAEQYAILCIMPHLFNHLSVDGHFSYFHLLPIVNNALVNIVVQISVQVSAFNSFGFMSRSRIAGLCTVVLRMSEVAQSCPTPCNPMDCSLPGSSIHDFPGKNTGVDCHSLLQGIFPSQESNPVLPPCRWIL